MTENRYKVNPGFGGEIYPSDFDTAYRRTRHMAERIEKDFCFDEHCRKNEIARDKRRKEEQQ